MLTAPTQLTLHVQQRRPEGGWNCAVVSGDQRQLISLPSDEAIAEFVAEQLEHIVNEAIRQASTQSLREEHR